MNTKILFKVVVPILITLGGLGLMAWVLQAITWAPLLLTSVSWNA